MNVWLSSLKFLLKEMHYKFEDVTIKYGKAAIKCPDMLGCRTLGRQKLDLFCFLNTSQSVKEIFWTRQS
jgi:hypothetical protein